MRLLRQAIRSHHGVSMLELLVYVSIMSMLLLLTSQFAVDMIRGQRRSSEVQRVHQAVRQVVTLMSNDLRAAQSVTTASSTFNVDNGVLVFVDQAGIPVQYDVATSTLRRTSGSGSPIAVTSNTVDVEKFRVEYFQDPLKSLESLRFTLQLSAGYAGTPQFYRQQYITAVTLR